MELGQSTERVKLFNESMVSLTSAMLPELLMSYNFSELGTLMDAGGGFGQVMCATLKKYRAMRGIVFDLPRCAEGARKNLAESGVADRCEFLGGIFFESIPAVAEAILLKSILHNWNDERCIRILRNCHSALKPVGRLIVVDRVMPQRLGTEPDHVAATLSDLNMLRGPGGCERTEREFRELLTKGGFNLNRIVPAGRYCVIEAIVA